MSSLDKHTMHYFRDEIEKTAIIAPMAKGVWKMVSGAGRAAAKGVAQGTKNLNKFYTNRLAADAIKDGGKIGLHHQIGAGLLTAGTIGAGAYGTKKGFDTYKENQQKLKQTGPVRQAGVQDL